MSPQVKSKSNVSKIATELDLMALIIWPWYVPI